MLTRPAGSEGVVTQGSPDATDLVGGHAHADAGAADQDATVHRPVHHGLCDLPAVIGIVHGIGAAGAIVHDLYVVDLLEEIQEVFLELPAAVVSADGDLHREGIPFGTSKGL